TLAGQVVDSQVVATAEDLIENDLVTFTGSPEVTDGTITLSGGTDTAGTGADYADFFDAIQVYDFNTMAIPVEDSATKALAAGFARRVREEEGKKVQAVLGNYEGADFEGVINLANGVILDGQALTPEQATAWFAGAAAAAGVSSSLT